MNASSIGSNRCCFLRHMYRTLQEQTCAQNTYCQARCCLCCLAGLCNPHQTQSCQEHQSVLYMPHVASDVLQQLWVRPAGAREECRQPHLLSTDRNVSVGFSPPARSMCVLPLRTTHQSISVTCNEPSRTVSLPRTVSQVKSGGMVRFLAGLEHGLLNSVKTM